MNKGNVLVIGNSGVGKSTLINAVLGEKTVEDIDWATKILESKLTNEMVDKFNKVVSKLNGKYDKDSIGEAIKEMFTK